MFIGMGVPIFWIPDRGFFWQKKKLTAFQAIHAQRFKTAAIVPCKTTNEYFQYLFEIDELPMRFKQVKAPTKANSLVLHTPLRGLLFTSA